MPTFIQPLIWNNGVAESGPGELIDPATLGTGTPNSTTFLRGDSTWAVPDLSLGDITPTSVTSAGNISGSTFTVNNDAIIACTSFSTMTTSPTVIAIVPIATYRSAEFLIQGVDTVSPKYHMTKIHAIHNGSIVSTTEYGAIDIGGAVATYSVNIAGFNMQLVATPTLANTTVYKITIIATVL